MRRMRRAVLSRFPGWRFYKWIGGLGAGAVGLAAAGGWLWFFLWWHLPSSNPDPSLVRIEQGASAYSVAQQLQEQGHINSAFVFRWSLFLFGDAGRLRTGEYRIEARRSPKAIHRHLMEGRPLQRYFTLVEGWSVRTAVAVLRKQKEIKGDIPTLPEEGSLLPDTYAFEFFETREQLMARMQAAMTQELDKIWNERQEGLAISTKQEALILASLIEKEAARDDERSLISGVFHNRLREGWRLQADPSLIYHITQGKSSLSRGIRRSELRADHPYNLYLYHGLPPTPIANPGRASLRAAVAPAKTRAFFFVADGKGGHHFSEKLSEHNRHVRALRRLERER